MGLSKLVFAIFLLVKASFAFKMGTHIASANKTSNQISAFIVPTKSTPDHLEFLVEGKVFKVAVSKKDAFDAIMREPEAYRAGVIGPDGFPDLISGQSFHHGNGSDAALKILSKATEGLLTSSLKGSHELFENRVGPSQYRSIDFAMLMLKHLQEVYVPANDKDKWMALAFTMGYFSHLVGDAFAHTWVNELTDGAWDLENGKGAFCAQTEEIKHMAVEGYLDTRVPVYLRGTSTTDYSKYEIQAPIKFLDSFLSKEAPSVQSYGDDKGDFDEFVKYFRHTDRFLGGPFYNYFNSQIAIEYGHENWHFAAKLLGLFGGATVPDGIEDIIEWYTLPDELLNDLKDWVEGDVLEFISGGFVQCDFVEDSEGINSLIDFWQYMYSVDNFIDALNEMGEISRINWLKLSQCTAKNLSITNAPDYDPAKPSLNRDACTEMAEAEYDLTGTGVSKGVYDRFGGASPIGLIKAHSQKVREFFKGPKKADVELFMGAIENMVKAENPQAYAMAKAAGVFRVDYEKFERDNLHRSTVSNLMRQYLYLIGPAYLMDDLYNIVLPPSLVSSSGKTCDQVRKPGSATCLDLMIEPLYVIQEGFNCVKNWGMCQANAISGCLSNVCEASCNDATSFTVGKLYVGPFEVFGGITYSLFDILEIGGIGTGCGGLCKLAHEACLELKSACDQKISYDVIIGKGEISFAIPGCKSAIETVCSPLSPAGDSYATCGLKRGGPGTLCHLEQSEACAESIIRDQVDILYNGKGYGPKILAPLIETCNTIDEYKAKLEEYQTPQKILQVLQKNGVQIAQVMTLITAAPVILDISRTSSPAALVNAVFLNDDVKSDPSYKAKVIAAFAGSSDPRVVAVSQSLANNLDMGLNFCSVNPTELSEDLATFKSIQMQGIFESLEGPTLQKVNNDVGQNMEEDFDPFFNTVHGMMLAPINSRADIEGILAVDNPALERLPWKDLGKIHYSKLCKDDLTTNIFCDVLISNDDPTCMNCVTTVDPWGPVGSWKVGRGLIPWNAETGASAGEGNFLTHFPLASTQNAYDKVYTRIFRVPKLNPDAMAFEPAFGSWVSTGEATHASETASQGRFSLRIDQGGWQQVTSPAFSTSEVKYLSNELCVDFYMPAPKPYPWWIGNLAVNVSIPSAQVWGQHLGTADFQQFEAGRWNTIKLPVPAFVTEAFKQNHPDAQFVMSINTIEGHQYFYLDNIRFCGNVVPRPALGSGSNTPPTSSGIPAFNFESLPDWSSPHTSLSLSPTLKTEGAHSLAIPTSSSGWIQIESKSISNSDLPTAKAKVAADFRIPRETPNPWWRGNLSLSITCPESGDWGVSLGQQSLNGIAVEEFVRLEYPISPSIKAAMDGPGSCKFTWTLNVETGSGIFYLDQMRIMGE